jgi:SAM-dependent methyltransferase
MDLHDFSDVAENYDLYVDILIGKSGLNTSDCINFHEELAEKYGQEGIVDLGCGTGLILIPLLEKGYTVCGVDISQEMINVVRTKLKGGEKTCELICSDMKDFNLAGKASLVVIPRSGFLHLLSTSEQLATLKNINSNLLPGGILSLNTYFPSYEFIAQNGAGANKDPFFRNSFTSSNGNTVEIHNLLQFHYEQQIIEGKWIFKELDNNGQVVEIKERPLKMRWTFKSEMELLFELCGFEVVEIYGGYDKSQPCYPGNIVWVVKKVRDV